MAPSLNAITSGIKIIRKLVKNIVSSQQEKRLQAQLILPIMEKIHKFQHNSL